MTTTGVPSSNLPEPLTSTRRSTRQTAAALQNDPASPVPQYTPVTNRRVGHIQDDGAIVPQTVSRLQNMAAKDNIFIFLMDDVPEEYGPINFLPLAVFNYEFVNKFVGKDFKACVANFGKIIPPVASAIGPIAPPAVPIPIPSVVAPASPTRPAPAAPVSPKDNPVPAAAMASIVPRASPIHSPPAQPKSPKASSPPTKKDQLQARRQALEDEYYQLTLATLPANTWIIKDPLPVLPNDVATRTQIDRNNKLLQENYGHLHRLGELGRLLVELYKEMKEKGFMADGEGIFRILSKEEVRGLDEWLEEANKKTREGGDEPMAWDGKEWKW